MRHWISERAGRVTASIAARPPSADNGLRLSLFAAPIRGLAVVTVLLIAAAPVRAWADPCPPPKDGIFGGPFCPQAFLHSSSAPGGAKHRAARHIHAAVAESFAEGEGTATCGDFNKDIAEGGPVEQRYFTWARGFMTGMDLIQTNDSGQSANLFSESEREQAQKIRRACAQNPDTLYLVAVLALFHTLPKNTPVKAAHKAF